MRSHRVVVRASVVQPGSWVTYCRGCPRVWYWSAWDSALWWANAHARCRVATGELRCHADRDGDCAWRLCPQLRDDEPKKSGRHCPIDDGEGR